MVRASAAYRSVVTSAGSPWALIAGEKNVVAAFTSRFFEMYTSMTCPYWSTARYTSRQVPGHLHVGLVDEPPVTDAMTARPGCSHQQGREPLHPPIQG